MSRTNRDLVEITIDAVNRRDAVTLESIAGGNFEFHSAFTATEGRVTRGSEALSVIGEAFDDWWLEVKEVVELTEDRAVVRVSISARGKGSGIRLDQDFGWVFDFMDGKIERLRSFLDPVEALEAARLSE